jgi:hypothetical protein
MACLDDSDPSPPTEGGGDCEKLNLLAGSTGIDAHNKPEKGESYSPAKENERPYLRALHPAKVGFIRITLERLPVRAVTLTVTLKGLFAAPVGWRTNPHALRIGHGRTSGGKLSCRLSTPTLI